MPHALEAMETEPFDNIGLAALETRLRHDLHCLCCPPASWVPRWADAERDVSDVVIIGGGMCGALTWLSLRTAGIENMRILDRNTRGLEGPWLNYARMETLRSPKHLTGPAYGLGSLTFQAWYRAQFGAVEWDALDKIPRPMWMDYLIWYREVLDIPVENEITLNNVSPEGELLRLDVSGCNTGQILTRKLIFATGREGTGQPAIPEFVNDLPHDCWAHTADEIDFNALQHKRVAVIGVGASAVDNAAEALEAGAVEVRHLIRRTEMPTINKMMGIGSYGFTAGYAALSDEWRWRIMRYSVVTQTPAPRGSTLRVSRHANAYFHFGKTVKSMYHKNDVVHINFDDSTQLQTDYVILGTGFKIDPMSRVEFGAAAEDILLWQDVYTPPPEETCADLGKFPYLAEDFTFRGKSPEVTRWLKHIYCFNFGATMSLGKVSGDIPGISEGARWLARGVSSQLYTEDIETHWQGLLDYSKPELRGDEWSPSTVKFASKTDKE